MASEWLPSEHEWLNGITERVFSGEIVLIRSLPRWGLSTVCGTIVNGLGDTAVVVEGRSVSESSQKSWRASLDADVTTMIASKGFAQLIFDDYGHAIRRSQGGALHSMLYRLLVDSDNARDTGALLIARAGDMLDLNFAGSPLLSRAETVALPTLEEADADALGLDLNDLRRQVGDSTWLARRFMNRAPHQARVSVVEHLNNDRQRIAAALPPAATQVLAGARTYFEADPLGQEALRCLGLVVEEQFELSSLVAESRLMDEIRLQSPGWPASRSESVLRFADLLAGQNDAIWVDRYVFGQPRLVRRFLDELRVVTSARIRILASRDHDRASLAAEIATQLDGLSSVEVRFMNRVDRHRLHDRHLIFPANKTGFVLPTAGVILGEDDPGSHVSVRMPALAINYEECWQRGQKVFPV